MLPMANNASCTGSLRYLLVRSLLAVGITLLAACSGSSSSGSPSGDTRTEGTVLSNQAALDLLKRSIETEESVGSFRSVGKISGTVLGEKVSMEMDMELARNDWIHYNVRLDTPEGDLNIEQIIAPPHVYINLPDANTGWVRADLEDVAREAGISEESLADPASYSANFLSAGKTPWELYTVTSLGVQTIGGVQSQRLRLEADFAELLARLTPEGKQQFAQSLGPISSLIAGDSAQEIDIQNLEMWLDDSGLTRQFAMNMTMGEEIELEMDLLFKDYNKDIVVKLPDEFIDAR